MYRLAIIDDNESWCFLLALRLQQQGYAVFTFTNVQAFLRQVEQFDLVLVDFSMPSPVYQRGMDGPEVIRQVKQQLANPPLLVLMSSFFPRDLLNHVADVCPEADAVLSKQVETAELFAQIRELLARQTQSHQAQTKQQSDRMSASSASSGSDPRAAFDVQPRRL